MDEKKLGFLSEATRKRCRIFQLDEKTERRFVMVNPEHFHFLYEVSAIDFALYFRVDEIMIEFIKPNEFCPEFLDQLWNAMQKKRSYIGIYVLNGAKASFEQTIEYVRDRKIAKLLNQQPSLDQKVVEVFSQLSAVSQMIVRGGITADTVARVRSSTAFMVSNIAHNQTALATLSRMVLHDPSLYDHCASVAMISCVIASTCFDEPLSEKLTELLCLCGMYHDVGKTCVPSAILNKPGRFTKEEFAVMKTHASAGRQELERARAAGAPIDASALVVAEEHHERWDGHGYPYGRRGRVEDDPEHGVALFSRIVMIADVYSALLMKRVYRPAYEPSAAISVMSETANIDYDPVIYSRFRANVVDSLNDLQRRSAPHGKGRIFLIGDDGKISERPVADMAKKPG